VVFLTGLYIFIILNTVVHYVRVFLFQVTFTMFTKYSVQEAYFVAELDIVRVLEEEIFRIFSRRIGFYKRIKSEEIIRSKI